MLDPAALALACAAMLALAIAGWLWSLPRRDVSGVDSLWPLLFLCAALAYAWRAGGAGTRGTLLIGLLALWALRLCVHLTVRNHGQPEDRRYQAIRRRNEPGFQWKSLYLVYLLQAALAGVIVLPVLAALGSTAPLGPWDVAGLVLFLAGFGFEAIADAQLTRFRADPARRGTVLDTGLWRYTRHPNYFGEALAWWGLFLFAAAVDAWWAIVGPLLLTFLLLRVSGVTLLESDIAERRPGYRDYARRTSAFLPRPPRGAAAIAEQQP